MAHKQKTWHHAVRIALVAAGLLVFTAPASAAPASQEASPSQDLQKAGESDPTNPIPWKT